MRAVTIGITMSIALSVVTANAQSQAVPGPPPPPPSAPPPGAPIPPVYVAPPPPGAQERTANNGLYIEGLGPGLFYSLDYDRAISDLAVRVGVGYVSLGASAGDSSAKASLLTVPVTLSYIGLGSKKHMFEVGAGVTVIHAAAGTSTLRYDSGSESATKVWGTAVLGYRLQPPDGGFMLRTGLSPIIGSGFFLPWPYIALGATF